MTKTYTTSCELQVSKVWCLTAKKCRIKVNKTKFFSVIYYETGVHSDLKKVAAIQALPAPTNIAQSKKFLGIVTYTSPFIPNLSDFTAPLKKEVEFDWSPSHEEAFQKVKWNISNKVTLTYFDPTVDTVIQIEASQKGPDATLLQQDCPVAFASESLP